MSLASPTPHPPGHVSATPTVLCEDHPGQAWTLWHQEHCGPGVPAVIFDNITNWQREIVFTKITEVEDLYGPMDAVTPYQ